MQAPWPHQARALCPRLPRHDDGFQVDVTKVAGFQVGLNLKMKMVVEKVMEMIDRGHGEGKRKEDSGKGNLKKT